MMRGLVVAGFAAALGCAGAGPELWPDAIRGEVERLSDDTPPPVSPHEIFVPPGVELSDGVTRDEAVALALWNNAAFAEALAGLGTSRAAIVQAGMLANPSLSVLLPQGPKQLEFALTFPIDAVWLRPKRLAVARAEAGRAAAQLVQGGLDLARDVRGAAVELERTQRRLRIAEEGRALRAEIASIAERRLALGEASALETGPARTDAIAAEQELTRARIAAADAEQRLLSLAGFEPGTSAPAYVPLPRREACGGELEALWRDALATRPDFRAAWLAVEAAAARGDLAVAEIFTLSAIYDANGKGSAGFESGPGLTTVLPILNQNQGGRARAAAEGDVATAAWITLLARARLELTLALARERATAAALDASRRELAGLEEQLGQARGGNALGEVPYLGVLEAQRTLLAARAADVDFTGEHDLACVEIEHAAGTRLDAPREATLARLPESLP